MAESQGFEPWMDNKAHTALAGQRLQPLGQLSALSGFHRMMNPRKSLKEQTATVAVGVGFEPTELSFNGFQDRRLRPLGHPTLSYPTAPRPLALRYFLSFAPPSGFHQQPTGLLFYQTTPAVSTGNKGGMFKNVIYIPKG